MKVDKTTLQNQNQLFFPVHVTFLFTTKFGSLKDMHFQIWLIKKQKSKSKNKKTTKKNKKNK